MGVGPSDFPLAHELHGCDDATAHTTQGKKRGGRRETLNAVEYQPQYTRKYYKRNDESRKQREEEERSTIKNVVVHVVLY